MPLRVPTLLNSMDRQCGQPVENSFKPPRIMSLLPFSRRAPEMPWNRVGGDRCAGWPPSGSPPGLPSVVPVFSDPAPTPWPDPWPAILDACDVLLIVYPSSFIPALCIQSSSTFPSQPRVFGPGVAGRAPRQPPFFRLSLGSPGFRRSRWKYRCAAGYGLG
jgi:hypothetical protein